MYNNEVDRIEQEQTTDHSAIREGATNSESGGVWRSDEEKQSNKTLTEKYIEICKSMVPAIGYFVNIESSNGRGSNSEYQSVIRHLLSLEKQITKLKIDVRQERDSSKRKKLNNL